jgi:hypothetical protein
MPTKSVSLPVRVAKPSKDSAVTRVEKARPRPVMPLLDGGRMHYPKPLLSGSERNFLDLLGEAVPEYRIFSQVCMGALIDPPGYFHGMQRVRARSAYASKIVDYVVYDTSANKVVCLVELDDYSHDNKKEEDAARDAMVAEAGYVTVRADGRWLPSQGALRKSVLEARSGRSRKGNQCRNGFSWGFLRKNYPWLLACLALPAAYGLLVAFISVLDGA